MEDKLIIKYIKKSNEKGLELLVEKYGGLIKGVINRYLFKLQSYEEECFDDILLSIWNNIDKFDEDKNSIRNWIISISRYKSIDYKRKYLSKLINQKVDINLIKDNKAIDEDLLEEEINNEINELLSNLNDMDRQIFSKICFKEMDVSEISKEMNLKNSYIYNRISRGRNKLRKIFLLNREGVKDEKSV
ncbi:sigma-70 family RNA polymerase sigma factor [Clostridium sp. CTA-5]